MCIYVYLQYVGILRLWKYTLVYLDNKMLFKVSQSLKWRPQVLEDYHINWRVICSFMTWENSPPSSAKKLRWTLLSSAKSEFWENDRILGKSQKSQNKVRIQRLWKKRKRKAENPHLKEARTNKCLISCFERSSSQPLTESHDGQTFKSCKMFW